MASAAVYSDEKESMLNHPAVGYGGKVAVIRLAFCGRTTAHHETRPNNALTLLANADDGLRTTPPAFTRRTPLFTCLQAEMISHVGILPAGE